MNVACLQMPVLWEDKVAAHRYVAAQLDAAALGRGTLLLLPELFATGFSMNIDAVAEEPASGPTHGFLRELAASRGIYILAGLATRAANGRGRNQAVLFAPDGGELLRYTKIHPFGAEAEHFEPGREVVAVELGGFTVCPLICYDLRFPELYRTAALRRKVDLILQIAAWPLPRDGHWNTLLAARAIENQAFVAAVNFCGSDPYHRYPGRSQILDPQGNILAAAGYEPGLIQAKLDRDVVTNWRARFPALKDAGHSL
jgi:predicted amidohydrolase